MHRHRRGRGPARLIERRRKGATLIPARARRVRMLLGRVNAFIADRKQSIYSAPTVEEHSPLQPLKGLFV